MTRSNLIRAGLYFLLALIFVHGLPAQTGTTSLHGVVMDKTGAAIVGAKVTLVNTAQGTSRVTTSGSSGEYQFLSLPPGSYAVTVEMAGFSKFEQARLPLLVNSPATLNVKLEIGSTSQTVEVSAAAETLNTTDASLGTPFDANQIQQLPLEARNVPDLLSLQAGVAYTGNRTDINLDEDTRSGAVNGAHSDQSNITLDGIDVNSDTKGYAFQSVLPVTPDSIQEFRVTTTNYNADEGRSSGAQVALVTKSGTNQFHGAAYDYIRNTYTSANDYFIKLAQLQSGGPNKAPKLNWNIPGADVGGPILKDRLFFFVNYEANREREQNSVVRVVPSAAMRDGVITYNCAPVLDANGNVIQTPQQVCPASSVQGLTASHQIAAGNFGLGPAQLKAMDPQGTGLSTNVMMPYLNSFPMPNDNSVGDGLNFTGFRFPGAEAIDTNAYIARLDYKVTSSGNQTLFWRGNLSNNFDDGVPYLPGGPPELTTVNYSKGLAVGYTAVLRPTLVNNLRYGFTRESFGEIGNQTQPVVFFRGLNDDSTPNNSSLAVTNNNEYQVPVHDFVDDVSWVKGTHTLQFGANVEFLRNPQSSNINSFSSAVTNASWFDTAALANTGAIGHFDPYCSTTANTTTGTCYDPVANPTEPHYPQVDPGFGNNYDYPLITMIGMIPQVNAQYNFTRNGTTLLQGAPVVRHFAEDSYEFYAQDIWKIKSNFTLTYGLRYSLFSPPWETNGLQVTPNVNLSDWFATRAQNMLNGIGSNAAPLLSFNLAGPANGKPGFYNWDTKDFAPRLAVAYSPSASGGLLHALFGGPGKTSIRAGAGIVYDRIGPQLLATFDQSGSFGLSTSLTNTGGVETPAIAPRITGLNNIPAYDLASPPNQLLASAPTATFPQTFPYGTQTGSFAVYWGMDQGLKTPYAYTLDFSVGRDLGRGMTLQVSYVGRLAHRLLVQEDVATPEDLVDPKTHMDYFTAVQALANVYRQGVATNNVTDSMFGAAAQYWTDILQPPTHGQYLISRCNTGGSSSSYGTSDPAIAAYDLFCGFANNETTAIQGIDQGFGITDMSGNPYYANDGPYTFLSPQFAALYAWRSIGTSSYNALQVNLNRRMTHGLQFGFNYTYSRSIDLSSDAYRIAAEGGQLNNGGQIINAWDPRALRGVSDFDMPHQFNANWIWQMPFGNGRWLAHNASKPLDAFIGGWQFSGLARWTSGLPFGISNGAQWPTNWQLSGYATQIGPVKTVGAMKNPDGETNVFGDANAAAAAVANYAPDFPGQVGARNTLRGDGFAGLDLSLDKRWKMPWNDSQTLQFRWEVYNALNLTRFDVQTINNSITNSSTFGDYSGLLTNPRVMQFALRYEF
jgi:hypothetical protein